MKLWEEIIFLRSWYKGKYCVENVIPYYKPFIRPQQIDRHYYWTNFKIDEKITRNPPKEIDIKAKRHKGKKRYYDGDIYNLKLSKEIFDLSNFDIKSVRKNKLLRNCVKPETGLHIFNCAFKTKQVLLSDLKAK